MTSMKQHVNCQMQLRVESVVPAVVAISNERKEMIRCDLWTTNTGEKLPCFLLISMIKLYFRQISRINQIRNKSSFVSLVLVVEFEHAVTSWDYLNFDKIFYYQMIVDLFFIKGLQTFIYVLTAIWELDLLIAKY